MVKVRYLEPIYASVSNRLSHECKELISGFRDRKKQTVHETALVYIQDPSKTKHVSAMGAHCPNCGAPVTKLGAKFCKCCGSAVETVNRKVWKINSIKEEG